MEKTCEECGRPISICNAITLVDETVRKNGVTAVWSALEAERERRIWKDKD